MTGLLCILLPLGLAAALLWTPTARWLSLGCAGLDLVLALSLPWTGTSAGGWLLPDPLAIHVMALTGFAWLMASAAEPGSSPTAALVGLLNLALLSDGAGLTMVAAGGAGIAGVIGLRLAQPGPLLGAAATGTGLAVFGAILLYLGTTPALGPGWAALSWSALPETGPQANGLALGVSFVLILLGLAVACGLPVMWSAAKGSAMPTGLAMVAGPLSGVWLVVALRLRGVLDGNGRAISPGWLLLLAGLAGLVYAALCLRRPGGALPAALVAVLAAAVTGFGVGGAAATGAGLLHLTLGCLALTSAAAGSRLGFASLAGVPPLGVFASAFALTTETAGRNGVVASLLGLGLFGVAVLGLRALPPAAAASRLSWIGVALALVGAWAMPPALTAWIQGIAAAAR